MKKSNHQSAERWRIFCAIEIAEPIRLRIQEHIMKLRALVPDARASWSRDSNIHLTLKFFGETEVKRVPKVGAAISRAVAEVQPFQLLLSGTGVFPPRRDPRVLWIGIEDPTASLARLHSVLEEESAKEGFSKDERKFHPHLTLARLRDRQGAVELAQSHANLKFSSEEMLVTELVLIRSELSSAGSKYTIVSRHSLAT